MNEPTYLLLTAVAVLVALTVHEYAHALVSTRLGDPTPAYAGRLNLNPLRHIDPIGALAMLLFGIGWAKPVPINPSYYRHPKRGMALTSIAGPLSNLLLAFFSCLLFLLSAKAYAAALGSFPIASLPVRLLYHLAVFLNLFHYLNLCLAIFNLLPLPPLDGSRLLYLVLPARAHSWFIRHERYIYFGVLAWLILGDRFFGILMRVTLISGSGILTFIASLFAPTVWISAVADALSVLTIRFWTLLPFLN